MDRLARGAPAALPPHSASHPPGDGSPRGSRARPGSAILRAARFLLIPILLALVVPASARAEPDAARAELQRMLSRYERWVRSQQDTVYGWPRDYVWPMPLYYIGEMYHALYRLTGEERYRAEVLRAANAAIRWGPQGLWYSYRGDDELPPVPVPIASPLFAELPREPVAILNALFAELLLDAGDLSAQPRYAAYATQAMEQLRWTFLSSLYGDDHPQDYYMLPFYALAQYLHRTGRDDPVLRSLGDRLYALGTETLDRSTFRWYYNREEHSRGFYDGHAAYYQSVSTLFFLHNAAHVRAVYPAQHAELSRLLPGLAAVALDGAQGNGTYYYSDGVPDYTESAAQVIWLADASQRLFGGDRQQIIAAARQTLRERQKSDGAFLSSGPYSGTWIGYSDSIGWALALWRLGGLPDVRPASSAVYVPRAGCCEPGTLAERSAAP